MSIAEFEMYMKFAEAEEEMREGMNQQRLPPLRDTKRGLVSVEQVHMRDNAHRYLGFLFKTYWKRQNDLKKKKARTNAFHPSQKPDCELVLQISYNHIWHV